jgi:hypothetical protein
MDQHPCKPTAKKAVTLSDIKAELRAINKRLGLDFPLMLFKGTWDQVQKLIVHDLKELIEALEQGWSLKRPEPPEPPQPAD